MKKAKKRKAAVKRGKKGALEDSEDCGQNGTQASCMDDESVPDSQAETRPEIGGRDSGLSLFRALGKFLYNKRVDADVSGQVNADGDVSKDGALREELRRRPMAASQPPEATLARAHLDGPAVTAFLHENVPHFVHDDAIDDVSVTSAYFSDADHILRRRTGGARASPAEDQGAEPDPGRVGHAAAAAIAARGVLFGVVHPSTRRFQAFRAPVSGQVERRRMETLVSGSEVQGDGEIFSIRTSWKAQQMNSGRSSLFARSRQSNLRGALGQFRPARESMRFLKTVAGLLSRCFVPPSDLQMLSVHVQVPRASRLIERAV